MDITFVQFLLICAGLCVFCWWIATGNKRASDYQDVRIKTSNADLTHAKNLVGIEQARYDQALVQACWVNMPQAIENHRKSLEVANYALNARSAMIQNAMLSGVSEEFYQQTLMMKHQLQNQITLEQAQLQNKVEFERERTRNQIATNAHSTQMELQRIKADYDGKIALDTTHSDGLVKQAYAQYGLTFNQMTGEVMKHKLIGDNKIDHSRQALDVQDEKHWREQARAKLVAKETKKKEGQKQKEAKEKVKDAEYTPRRSMRMEPPINTNRRNA